MSEQRGPAAPDEPEFGPGGYLPQRAAKRARKIVLRAPMGMHWIWGAVAVGVAVLIVGIVFLSTAGGPPGAPYVVLADVDDVREGPLPESTSSASDGGVEYLSTSAGRLRLFHVEPEAWPLAWCEASRRLEGRGGVWSPTGRGLGGAASLAEHPTVIVDGVVYWDPSTTLPGPVSDPGAVARAC